MNEVYERIVWGFFRNFGGLAIGQEYIAEKLRQFCQEMQQNLYFPTSIDCIKQNLIENEENNHTRNLMILTDNFDTIHNFLKTECQEK